MGTKYAAATWSIRPVRVNDHDIILDKIITSFYSRLDKRDNIVAISTGNVKHASTAQLQGAPGVTSVHSLDLHVMTIGQQWKQTPRYMHTTHAARVLDKIDMTDNR